MKIKGNLKIRIEEREIAIPKGHLRAIETIDFRNSESLGEDLNVRGNINLQVQIGSHSIRHSFQIIENI
jgi:hypothetical protein